MCKGQLPFKLNSQVKIKKKERKKTQTYEPMAAGIFIKDVNLPQTQISNKDYKIRMFKVIKGKK